MIIARASFVAILTAVVISGCASAPVHSLGAEASGETPTATPTAAQERETGLVAPQRPFGGDCAGVMSDGEATAILGQSVVLSADEDQPFAPEVSIELHAGLACRWVSSDGSYSTSLSVVFLPADAVSYDAPTGCLPEDSERWARCAVETVVNGTRVSGSLWNASDPIEKIATAADSFLALFEERANAITPAPVPLPAVGAWAHPVDCTAVVAAGDFSGVPGLGAASVGMRFPFGGHDYATPAADALENGSAEFPYCWIDGELADITFVASGGGRWLESTVSASGTVFAIDGYESAYSTPGQEGLTRVDIFDGPNWLHFQVRYTSNAKALADALFAGLNTSAAP